MALRTSARAIGYLSSSVAADYRLSALLRTLFQHLRGDFEQCRHEKNNTAGMVWQEPVTVFLNAACDNSIPYSSVCRYDSTGVQ